MAKAINVPREIDSTKYGLEIDSASGALWQEGCVGPMEVRGFLDLSRVESEFPAWGKHNRNWITRATRGSGVAGGPEKTRTTYFYETGVWTPFGSTWGAPFAPKDLCEIPEPTPLPTDFWPWPEPTPSDGSFPGDPGDPGLPIDPGPPVVPPGEPGPP